MTNHLENYFIKQGYVARKKAAYFEDSIGSRAGIVHQPDVYALAGYIGRRFGCTHILDIGCGRANKLVEMHPQFKVIGVDFGANLDYCQSHYPFGKWLARDLEQPQVDLLPPDVLNKTLVVCSDVIEHLANPKALLDTLKQCLGHAPVAILSTPERDLVRGATDFGPPDNPAHVREWNRTELSNLLEASSLRVAFMGLTCNNDRDLEKKTCLAVLHGKGLTWLDLPVQPGFRVVAFMTAFNEEDIIYQSVSRLIRSGVEVYLIDNWSTDNTVKAVESLLGKGLIGIERFPAQGGTGTYDWGDLLGRVEELSQSMQADWFIHHDVDEVRESPWPERSLREALYLVDQMGFNAVDHTVIDFRPVDNGFTQGGDFAAYFTHWEFGRRAGHFQQVKAWKNQRQPVALAYAGGHNADFPGRKVFPYKFLLRHYPVRSQEHGEKKVLGERKPRFNPEEKDVKGWHVQYDHIETGYNFLYHPESLSIFDSAGFYNEYLVERISGIGIVRQTPSDPKEDWIGKLRRRVNSLIGLT
ncbi:MAG: methyltransferase domain-containing protein [Gallionellaceae bacterium]|nr:methyltransferase domain-containing protein [Gallionellaceae bacterium]